MKVFKKRSAKLFTNFVCGGKVKYFIEASNKNDLVKSLNFAKEKDLDYRIIGDGCNVLISDKNLKLVLIKLTNNSITVKGNKIIAGAGAKWDDVVKLAINNNLAGIECLSGIPGSIGAAPVQNIGAYGQEVANVLDYVVVYDIEEKNFKKLTNIDCKFSYRHSLFKETDRYIIYKIILKLNRKYKFKINYASLKERLKNKSLDLKMIRKEVLKIRKEKFGSINGIGTAGSFFKNPIISISKYNELLKIYPNIPHLKSSKDYKLYGAWLIEQAGWKGYKNNVVSVSDKNPLILENHSKKASSKDIYDLADKITEDVYQKFDIKLEPEVNLIGF